MGRRADGALVDELEKGVAEDNSVGHMASEIAATGTTERTYERNYGEVSKVARELGVSVATYPSENRRLSIS